MYQNRKLEIAILAFSCIATASLVLFFALRPYESPAQAAAVALALPSILEPHIDATGAIVIDATTGKILYAKNSETQLPLASITKLMTILVAGDVLDETDRITITDHALLRDGDSGLTLGDTWAFKDLADFTLISSSNDGAQAIADAAATKLPQQDFNTAMNAKAQEMGLAQTYFVDATGLDISREMASAYGSAADVAQLLITAVRTYPSLYSGTAQDGVLILSASSTHEANNTNESLGNIPGLIAGKTGFTDLAGGNLAVLFDAGLGKPIAVVVLHSSKEGRFRDVEKLVAYTQQILAQ